MRTMSTSTSGWSTSTSGWSTRSRWPSRASPTANWSPPLHEKPTEHGSALRQDSCAPASAPLGVRAAWSVRPVGGAYAGRAVEEPPAMTRIPRRIPMSVHTPPRMATAIPEPSPPPTSSRHAWESCTSSTACPTPRPFRRSTKARLPARHPGVPHRLPAASMHAQPAGMRSFGPDNRTVLITESLTDSHTLLLTANTETGARPGPGRRVPAPPRTSPARCRRATSSCARAPSATSCVTERGCF